MHRDLTDMKCVEGIFHETSQRMSEKQFLLKADMTFGRDPCALNTFRCVRSTSMPRHTSSCCCLFRYTNRTSSFVLEATLTDMQQRYRNHRSKGKKLWSFQKWKPTKCKIFVRFIMFYSLCFLQHVSASCHLRGGHITLLHKTLKTLKCAVRDIIKIFIKY
jgi:hypothetical protein